MQVLGPRKRRRGIFQVKLIVVGDLGMPGRVPQDMCGDQ